jgi:hypothetical protein
MFFYSSLAIAEKDVYSLTIYELMRLETQIIVDLEDRTGSKFEGSKIKDVSLSATQRRFDKELLIKSISHLSKAEMSLKERIQKRKRDGYPSLKIHFSSVIYKSIGDISYANAKIKDTEIFMGESSNISMTSLFLDKPVFLKISYSENGEILIEGNHYKKKPRQTLKLKLNRLPRNIFNTYIEMEII